MIPVNEKEDSGLSERVPKAPKPDSFEKNLERLDAIVHQLEEAEGRVEILRKRAGGRVVAEPLEEKK